MARVRAVGLALAGCLLLTLNGATWAETQVAGTVVDADGAPIAGADVFVVGDIERLEGPTLTTATDSEGKFAVSVGDDTIDMRRAALVARHPGYGLGWVMGNNVARGEQQLGDLKIVLPAAGTVQGKVMDEKGNPVAKAEIAAFIILTNENDMGRKFMVAEDWVLKPQLDSNGAFTLGVLPKDATYILRVNAPGYGRAVVGATEAENGRFPEGEIEAGAKDVVITMTPAATVEGTVTLEETGKPAEGVVIEARNAARGFDSHLMGIFTAKTDANGRYQLADLAPEAEYSVYTVSDLGFSEVKKVEIGAASVKGQDFVLGKGVRVAGKFIETDTGKPVTDGYVSISSPGSGRRPIEARTKEDGSFELYAPPGELRLFARSESHSLAQEEMNRQLTLVAGQDMTDIEIKAEAPLVFKGKVVDEKGKPVAGAEVRAKNRYQPDQQIDPVTTDKDGAFEVSLPNQNLGEWECAVIEATVADMPKHRGLLIKSLPTREDAQGTVAMHPMGTIRGRVVNQAGEPLPEAAVNVAVKHSINDNGWSTINEGKPKTDASGKFEFTTAVSGESYYVTATAGDTYGQRSFEVPEVLAGGAFDVPDLDLLPTDKIIEGTVFDSEGNAAAGVDVNCQGSAQPHRQATTDANGKFRFENIVNDEVHIYAHRQGDDGYAYGNALATGGDTDVEIALQDQGQRISPEDRQAARVVGKAAPQLDVASWSQAQPTSLAVLRGKPVVLAFVDMADDASEEAIKVLNGISKSDGAAVIGVQKPGAQAKVHGANFAVAVDKAVEGMPNGSTYADYRVKQTPAVYVIDKDGMVRFQDINPAALEQALASLTAE